MINDLHAPFLLLALPQLQDPNFLKAVVLVIDHSPEGAMGFVINRPSEVAVRDLIIKNDLEVPANLPAWLGGPVDSDNGLLLHNQGHEEGQTNLEGLTISSSKDALEGLVQYGKNYENHGKDLLNLPLSTRRSIDNPYQCLYPYRFLVGYSGWGAGQLEEELRLGAWLQMPFDSDIAFNTSWQTMWSNALQKVGIKPMDIAPTIHPYLN